MAVKKPLSLYSGNIQEIASTDTFPLANTALSEFNRQTASYTLVLGDASKFVEMNVATANNLTIPLNATVAFPIGIRINVVQYGAGVTTIVATGGVTIRSWLGASLALDQYKGGELVKVGTDEWYFLQVRAPINNYDQIAYELLGGTIKAEPLTGNIMNVTTSAAMLEGQVHFIAVYLPKAATITGAKWLQNIAGAYTSNDYNGIGVYSISAGTLTLVASSTDDGNIWKATANTIGSKAFSATAALAAGVYFIGFIISYSAQSTLPRLGCFAATANLINQSLDFTNSVKLNSYITAQTALPSSQAMSGTSLITAQFYVALY